MCLFVTGVGALIHLYSIGYMHGDPRFSKFFVYLNLFVFSMLMLVLGDNLLSPSSGWEGVGTCSYLLISFWFTSRTPTPRPARRPSSPTGSATWASWSRCSSSSPPSARSTTPTSRAGAGGLATTTATAIALLLFLGAVGKSAQLPLLRVAARRHGRPDARCRPSSTPPRWSPPAST